MSCVLEPGMKVVCERNVFPPGTTEAMYADYGVVFPSVGSIYTVREVLMYHHWNGAVPSIRLVEIVNPPRLWKSLAFNEVAFEASSFRPLRSRSTDISIFKEIVEEVKKGKVRKLEDVG